MKGDVKYHGKRVDHVRVREGRELFERLEELARLEGDREIKVAVLDEKQIESIVRDDLDIKIKALRDLVLWIRARVSTRPCGCHILNDFLCERCAVVGRIDADLSAISEMG
jgi:hypothetical protein